MGISFVCPNCRKLVDPMSGNATMATTTKLWQHKDCTAEPGAKTPATAPPKIERRRTPRR